ncbi:hypothetical protein F4861DRAFT_150368 [Xylaria intraflava]|nr:hypothetical protein F4861DRAFT_150368 [Xylaria intraflava]
MATPGTPKTMSSRLLTMKFMQRAAASNSTPSSAPSTPASNDSSKRRKISHSTTPQPNVDTLVNQAAVRAAIAEEEKKVEHAKLKRAEELGDAHWVLDIPQQPQAHATQSPMKVVQVGFAQIDSMDAAEDDESPDDSYYTTPAIRRYNMDKKKVKDKNKTPKESRHSSSESGSDSDSDVSSSSESSSSSDEIAGPQQFGSDSPNPSTTQLPTRKAREGKLSKEQRKAAEFAEKRRRKEVKLNNPKGGITSISAGGGPSPRSLMSLTCYRCGQPGHKSLDCKTRGKRPAH